MNLHPRTLRLIAATIAVWLNGHAMTQAEVASVGGTTFLDAGTLAGVSLNLYADNGDMLFDADTDTMINTMLSGATGEYSFADLDPSMNYFVFQGPQFVGSVELLSSVSGILDPLVETMMVDAFEQQQRVEGNPINGQGMTNLGSSSATVIGGQRDLYAEYISGPAEIVLHANPWGLNHVLQFDQSAGSMGTATITWDGLDSDMSTTPAANGLGGMDLTHDGGAAFSFMAGIDEAGAGDVLTLRIFSGDEVSIASVLIPVTNGTASEHVMVPFSSFSGGASFDLVDAIQAEIGGNNPSIDAQIGPINIVGGSTADFNLVSTPEPSAGILALPSMFALALLRKRRIV